MNLNAMLQRLLTPMLTKRIDDQLFGVKEGGQIANLGKLRGPSTAPTVTSAVSDITPLLEAAMDTGMVAVINKYVPKADRAAAIAEAESVFNAAIETQAATTKP